MNIGPRYKVALLAKSFCSAGSAVRFPQCYQAHDLAVIFLAAT